MAPVRLEALLEGNSAEIPVNTSLECNTPVVNLQNHPCTWSEGSFMLYTDPSQYTTSSDSVESLHQAGKWFLVYGKKLKRVVLDACGSIKRLSREVLDPRYMRYQLAKDVVDCIQEPSMEGNNDTARVHDSGGEETTTALPAEITEFYNSVIAPDITGTNNGSYLPGVGLNAVNGSFEALPQIEGPPQSSGTIAYCVGGVGLGLGCLIASIAAIAWKRTTLNEKRRKRYQEMVTSIVKSSENNSLDPPIPTV